MKKIETNEVAILMSAASTLASNISSMFTMFLSVVFGALVFSATLSLRHVGPTLGGESFSLSAGSLLIAFALSSFFIIGFLSFHQAQKNVYLVLQELAAHTSGWAFYHAETSNAFKPHSRPLIGSLGRESLGYIIGSVTTVISFLWLANMCRS